MDSHRQQQQHCGGVLAEAAPPIAVHCSSSRQLAGQATGLEAHSTVAPDTITAQVLKVVCICLLPRQSMPQLHLVIMKAWVIASAAPSVFCISAASDVV